MEEGDYLIMDPACEVNEKSTREKNYGNVVLEKETSPPLDLDPNETIEADFKTYHMQKRTGKAPSKKRFPRTSNRIYFIRCRRDELVGKDLRKIIILTGRLRSGQDRPDEDSRRSSGSGRDNCYTGSRR